MAKNKKIYRPKKGTEVPDAPVYDPATGEPMRVDRRQALSQWLKQSKMTSINDDECYSGLIDPKQAVYAKKEKK